MASKACLLVIAACLALMVPAFAEDYVVGGEQGWGIPPPLPAKFYQAWVNTATANGPLRVNDTLVFNYRGLPPHSVHLSFNDTGNPCNTSNGVDLLGTYGQAPRMFNYTFKRTGPHVFICSVSGHCTSGMQFVVNVSRELSILNPPGEMMTPEPAPAPVPEMMMPEPAPAPAPAPAPSSAMRDYPRFHAMVLVSLAMAIFAFLL